MHDAENQPPMSSLCLDVTLPCEPRYLPMLRLLAARTIEYIGYDRQSRDALVATLDSAIRGVFGEEADRYRAITLRFATSDHDMLIHIRYLGAPCDDRGPARIEDLLSRGAAGATPLERLRRDMTTVTVGRETGDDAAEFCNLTKTLPGDSE